MTTSTRRLTDLLAALLCLCLLPIIPVAWADTSAGEAAFDKGDYARAMSEWQTAADRGDAEAQLGLGKLYEFGLGDLAQNYKRADFWYRKAADQNNAEAQYRLALIWAVGGDDFAPDPAEAYKWLSLTLDSKGVWGTHAAELKQQFDRFVGPTGQAEGKRRAAAWREKYAAKTPSTNGPVAPAPAPTLPSSKCAGWPFPTLPCTEEFPAFPNVQPERRVVPPIPAQNAVATPALPPPATPILPPTSPSVTSSTLDPAIGRTLAGLNAMRAAGLLTDGNLGLRLPDGMAQLRQGDLIKVEVRGPAYPVNLRIDYFSLGGQVLHLWPNGDETAVNLAPQETRVFGQPGAHKVWAAGGAPFGTELITVIATAISLDLGSARRPVEQADDYLRDLKTALERSKSAAAAPNIVTTLLVHTSAH